MRERLQLEEKIDNIKSKVLELHTNLFYFTLDFRHHGQYEDYYKLIDINSLESNGKSLLEISRELLHFKNKLSGDSKGK